MLSPSALLNVDVDDRIRKVRAFDVDFNLHLFLK